MKNSKVYQWIIEEENRRKILIAINQPMTARAITQKGIEHITNVSALGGAVIGEVFRYFQNRV